MVALRINGRDQSLNIAGLQRVTDVVELIKSQIDPDHMITNIFVNGDEMADDLWTGSATQLETAIIEVETDNPETYVAERLNQAGAIIQNCFLQFRETRKTFQDGKSQAANQKLSAAVDTLKAFFDWYGTIISLVPEERRDTANLQGHAQKILETCQKICQFQLYQSWWAVGQAIEKDLEPALDSLEDYCRKSALQYAS